MKRLLAVLLAVSLLISGCGLTGETANKYSKYSYEFFETFDTVIKFIGYAQSQEEFTKYAEMGQARFEELHRLFNKYDTYPGVNNIKTINDNAGVKPVEVSQELLDLIIFSKEWYNKTNGVINIALGPVLNIWHDYRETGKNDPENAQLPSMEELKEAQTHTDIDKIIIDSEKKTIYLADSKMSLDVGAVAKGFAAEIVANELEKAGLDSLVMSAGGNIRVIGKPLDNVRNKWGIGIQDPNGNPLIPDDKPLDTLFVTDTSLVTSGDYQRYYTVDGQMIHHIIDPQTLMPANHYRAVTVMVRDSGLADFMSSTVFILPYEESRKLVESIEGLEALWIFSDDRIEISKGMKEVMKKFGGASYK